MRNRLVRWSTLAMLGVATSCASAQKTEPAKAEAPPAAAPATTPAAALPAVVAGVVTNPKEQPFPVVIGKAPVTIDGDLSDWPALPVGRVASADGSHACDFRVFVDATRLYAAFEVVDASPVPNAQGPGRNWQGDAVELFLGTHADSRGALNNGDVQVIVSYNPKAPLAWNYFSHKPMADAKVVVKDAPRGWLVEASFTMAELGLAAPAPGAPVWIDLALDSSEGAGRSGQFIWLGNADVWKTPSMWKKSVFVPQP
jgi:hypothetical protein